MIDKIWMIYISRNVDFVVKKEKRKEIALVE